MPKAVKDLWFSILALVDSLTPIWVPRDSKRTYFLSQTQEKASPNESFVHLLASQLIG